MQGVRFIDSIVLKLLVALLFLPVMFTLGGFYWFQRSETKRVERLSAIKLNQLEQMTTGLLLNLRETFKEKTLRLAADNQIIVPFKLNVDFQLKSHMAVLREQNQLKALALLSPQGQVVNQVGTVLFKAIPPPEFERPLRKAVEGENSTFFTDSAPLNELILASFTPVLSSKRVIAVLFTAKAVVLGRPFYNCILVSHGRVQTEGQSAAFLVPLIAEAQAATSLGPLNPTTPGVFATKLSIPGLASGEHFLIAGLDERSGFRAKQRMILAAAALGGLVLILMVGFAFFLSKWLTKPLSDLAAISNAIASDQTAVDWIEPRRDEIGVLSQSLKTMTARLQQTITKMNRANTGLDNARTELEASEKRYRTLIDTAGKANLGFVVVQNEGTAEGSIRFVNQGVVALTGYPEHELMAMGFEQLLSGEEQPNSDALKAPGGTLLRTAESMPFRGYRKDGKQIFVEAGRGTTEFDGKQAIVYYLKDVTEKHHTDHELEKYRTRLELMVDERTRALKQTLKDLQDTQSQLLQSEKMASIGQLAAGVAHELNQPLMVVRGTVQLLLRQMRRDCIDPQRLEPDLNIVIRNSKRMMNIINHLRVFSRQSDKNFEFLDLDRVIGDCFLMIGEQLKLNDIEVVRRLNFSAHRIRGNSNQLEQVFLNLITNARDAIMEKRKKTAETGKRHDSTGASSGQAANGRIEIVSRLSTQTRAEVEVLVRDNGIGVSNDHRREVFNPFFTTKGVGQGTGLGLSISYGIIKDHRGEIDIPKSGPAGSTFRVRLPVADADRARSP